MALAVAMDVAAATQLTLLRPTCIQFDTDVEAGLIFAVLSDGLSPFGTQ